MNIKQIVIRDRNKLDNRDLVLLDRYINKFDTFFDIDSKEIYVNLDENNVNKNKLLINYLNKIQYRKFWQVIS